MSGRARNAFDLKQENAKTKELYGNNTFGQSCLLARRLVEAGTRVVEVVWPKVANSNNHSWDVHQGLPKRMKDQSAPMLDKALSGLFTDLDERGMLDDTLVLCIGEFGRVRNWVCPQAATTTAPTVGITGLTATPGDRRAGIKRGNVFGKSDKTGSAPDADPIHPTELLATIYHAFGIHPNTIVYNHLNQPRELVKAEAQTKLFG